MDKKTYISINEVQKKSIDMFDPFGDDDSDYIDVTKKINVKKDTEEYYLDRIEELERDNKLIRYEMNAIELPLFTKDKKVKNAESKKYIFNQMKDQYVEVIPAGDEKIPSVFDEKVFLALLRIHKEQNYNKTIYTNFFSILKEAQLKDNGEMLKRIRSSLQRLSSTSYVFNNAFYSNDFGNILNDKITTNIFNLRIIDLLEAQNTIPDMNKYFRNNKVKEVIQISLSEYFYDNIIKRGYLYFSSEELLAIDNSIARTLYAMLTKWRKGDLYIKRHSRFLASRIPLSWKPNNIPKTIITIKNALDELKKSQLIKDYKFSEEIKQQDSYFEILFAKEHNKNYFNTKQSNDHENFTIENVIDKEIKPIYKISYTQNELEELAKICNFTNKITTDIALKEFSKYNEEKFDYLIFCLVRSLDKAENIVPYFNTIVTKKVLKSEYENIAATNKKKIENEQKILDEENARNNEQSMILEKFMSNKKSPEYILLREKVLASMKKTFYKNKDNIEEEKIEESMKIWLTMEQSS